MSYLLHPLSVFCSNAFGFLCTEQCSQMKEISRFNFRVQSHITQKGHWIRMDWIKLPFPIITRQTKPIMSLVLAGSHSITSLNTCVCVCACVFKSALTLDDCLNDNVLFPDQNLLEMEYSISDANILLNYIVMTWKVIAGV